MIAWMDDGVDDDEGIHHDPRPTDDDRRRWPGAIETLEGQGRSGLLYCDSNRVLWFQDDDWSDDVYWAGDGKWVEGDYEEDRFLPRPQQGFI